MRRFLSVKDLNKESFSEFEENFVPDDEILKSSHLLSVSPYSEVYTNKDIDFGSFCGFSGAGVKFYHCYFRDIDFTGAIFWMSAFDECLFERCNMDRAVFRKCEVFNCTFVESSSRYTFVFSESYLYGTNFIRCSALTGLQITGTDTVDCKFESCIISEALFQAIFTEKYLLSILPNKYLTEKDRKKLKSKRVLEDLVFKDCTIEFTNFRNIEFVDVKFKNTEIAKSSFIDCKMFDYNFNTINQKKGWGTNFIDFNTIKKSAGFSSLLLKNMFNLNFDDQEALSKIADDRRQRGVFISYSLKDSVIAMKINRYLQEHDIPTFLWEKDAQGGDTLKNIMKSNINANERLLFIASKNSLKSEACHFELTEGRRKQDRLWKTIFCPIHIDDFLFSVEYEDIRPLEKRDEYWKNITELRSIHSLDFSGVLKGFSRKRFETKMSDLIISLQR